MSDTDSVVQEGRCKFEVSHILSFISLFISTVWVVIFALAVFSQKRVQDIISNSLARQILFFIAFLSIAASVISISVDVREIGNKIKDKEQSDYRKKLLLEILSITSTCFFVCSTVLDLYSQLNSDEYAGNMSTNFSLTSEIFSLLNVSLVFYIGMKEVKALFFDSQLNNDRNLNANSEKKLLLWKVANDTILLVTTVINALYIIDDVLDEKVSINDYKTHNIIKLTNIICCIAVTFSILIFNQLEESSSSKVKNVNISYVDQTHEIVH